MNKSHYTLYRTLYTPLSFLWHHKFTTATLIVALVFGFQLYSLNSNPIYALTATGGTITTDSSATVEALVVGGGGGGAATPSGSAAGGGGGAGGYIASS